MIPPDSGTLESLKACKPVLHDCDHHQRCKHLKAKGNFDDVVLPFCNEIHLYSFSSLKSENVLPESDVFQDTYWFIILAAKSYTKTDNFFYMTQRKKVVSPNPQSFRGILKKYL